MRTSNLPHSFSGQDFNIWAYLPEVDTKAEDSAPVIFANLQTITTSLASSLAPVLAVGSDSVLGLTSGSKTFAGSLVFSVLDRDPLQDFIVREERRPRTVGYDFFTVDQLPPFNIVIQGSNEYLPGNWVSGKFQDPYGDKTEIFKLLIGVKLLTHGETISIDDFFTEQTYQYQARYITPWYTGTPSEYIRSAYNALPKLLDEDAIDEELISDSEMLSVVLASVEEKRRLQP